MFTKRAYRVAQLLGAECRATDQRQTHARLTNHYVHVGEPVTPVHDTTSPPQTVAKPKILTFLTLVRYLNATFTNTLSNYNTASGIFHIRTAGIPRPAVDMAVFLYGLVIKPAYHTSLLFFKQVFRHSCARRRRRRRPVRRAVHAFHNIRRYLARRLVDTA